MCGRYACYAKLAGLAGIYGASFDTLDIAPRYNIAPGSDIAVIAEEDSKRRMLSARWGLLPRWAKDIGDSHRLINARAETVSEKPSFRYAFTRSRCVIPADGFYEWRREGRRKTPYYFHPPEGTRLAFAGLMSPWRGPDGREILSAAIITTSAVEPVAAIHERMPVMLGVQDSLTWMAPATHEADLHALLQPPAPGMLECRMVADSVNSPSFEGEGCIAPLSA